METRPQLDALIDMSVRLGADDLLVQGAGGNTSLKREDVLWVKASGHWLADARARDIFVPLSLSAVRAEIAAGRGDRLDAQVLDGAGGLKPSIETALHALMPHPVVVHAHAVNSMTTGVLADGQARAAERLAGLNWRWITYHRPGRPLAAAIEAALAAGPADVLLLQNHGVVVGAADPAAAQALLSDVEHRLSFTLNPAGAWDPDSLAARADDRFEVHPLASDAAADPHMAGVLSQTPLVPDQIVFLGGAAPVLLAGEGFSTCEARVREGSGVEPMLIISPGQGAWARRDRSKGADALIRGLAQIAFRVPLGAPVRGLPDAAAAELLNWDAEHYRRALDAARGPTS